MRDEALAAIAAPRTSTRSSRSGSTHAGDRSPLALANREIGALPPQARKEAGQRVGQARGAVNQALARRQAELEAEPRRGCSSRRPSTSRCPGTASRAGARHPLTTLQERIADVFVAMGWEVAEGPEVEAEWLNFDALNLGPDHPARTHAGHLLPRARRRRAGAAHAHLAGAGPHACSTATPPIYVVCPGRVFRTDELDATHTPVFHQVEGLAVDKGITMAHLKGTLDHFAQAMFGDGDHDAVPPVVLPVHRAVAPRSTCSASSAAASSPTSRPAAPAGARAGSSGAAAAWSTRACWSPAASTPTIYTGFAFGMGIERTLMFRHGVEDMRDMVEGDVRFTLRLRDGDLNARPAVLAARRTSTCPADVDCRGAGRTG